MKRISYASAKVRKTLLFGEGKLIEDYENLLTGRRYTSCGGNVVIGSTRFGSRKKLPFSDMEVFSADESGYTLRDDGFGITVRVDCDEAECGALREKLTVTAEEDVFVHSVCLGGMIIADSSFTWQAPLGKRVFVPSKIARFGQPVYVGDVFIGAETPVAENGIVKGTARSVYHTARKFSELAEDGDAYSPPAFIVGAAKESGFDAVSDAFLRYVSEMALSDSFRVQFNSWYDNMLDIDPEKIEKSFTAVGEGMKKAGFRPLDCYVVDDGWTEYDKPLFWEFNSKFADGFVKESRLTEKLGGKFGVWFGPRGGYTSQTPVYAGLLEKIGYHSNRYSRDICTADPKYVFDLTDRMAEFCEKFNVDYFKIDGFAICSCPSAGHGHPSALCNVKGFYVYLWEQWLKGFEKIRRVCPGVCLNVTSYAHCSPWFLKWADFIWMNNASDMGYVGEGDSLSRCLNYRDSRYRALFLDDERQFPAGNLYNHEPCYAKRNFDPKFSKSSPVVYTDGQFELYMYCCMMRGSGLAELYFSPEMMNDAKWNIAARVLEWAESRHGILKYSRFFGSDPAKGGTYGYLAVGDNGDRVTMLRNSSGEVSEYELTMPDGKKTSGTLAPFETVITETVGGQTREIIRAKS